MRSTQAAFKHYDLGDILGARGTLFRTRTGELIRTCHRTFACSPNRCGHCRKNFTAWPIRNRNTASGISTLSPTKIAADVFITRSRIIQSIREFLVARGYLEVETPMMHPIPGGAAARPFVTHHNALDMELYLRIAPELYLKRLVVGGLERVFEINRSFRNEGISTRHNPEFTMLEFYEAYRDYTYLMDLTETMLRDIGGKSFGHDQNQLSGTRNRSCATIRTAHHYVQAIRKFHPEYTDAQLGERSFLVKTLQALRIAYKAEDGIGGLQLTLFDETTEHLLFDPVFIVDYPAEVSPLARRNDINPAITDRFELYIAGREIANGFSELNDPEDQAARFQEQASAKEAGDFEAMHYDADYIRALEYGLPPTAGEGIGIDRLVMLFTDSPSIRDVILFPQLRRED